jgi:hypothetical protein
MMTYREEIHYRIEYRSPSWKTGKWMTAYNARLGRSVTANTLEDAKRELANTKRRMRMHVLEFRIVRRITTENVIEL